VAAASGYTPSTSQPNNPARSSVDVPAPGDVFTPAQKQFGSDMLRKLYLGEPSQTEMKQRAAQDLQKQGGPNQADVLRKINDLVNAQGGSADRGDALRQRVIEGLKSGQFSLEQLLEMIQKTQ